MPSAGSRFVDCIGRGRLEDGCANGRGFQVPSDWSRDLELRAMIRIQLFLVEFPRVSLFLDHGAGFLKINFSPFYFKCASTPNSSARIKTNSCSKY
jgi:hypothetical protein